MGTVHLTGSHHGLTIRQRNVDLEERVLLTDELLARPILDSRRAPMGIAIMDRVIRAALQGLRDLRGFNAAVSYGVVVIDSVGHIVHPRRVWGEITLGSPKDVVVGFSHDTRYENHPFVSLLQWLEEESPGGQLNDAQLARFCEKWSSAERWRMFFEARIRREVAVIREASEKLRLRATALAAHADEVAAVLE